ncbi:copia protein [Tanacetum coccineum]
MPEELLQFKLQQVWTLVDLLHGKRAIGTKWVYRNKKDERGIVIRNKARLVSQGYTQEKGIYYEEVFAPVVRIKAIRLFIAYASYKDFVVYQIDVKSAFICGKIKEEVYVYQPLESLDTSKVQPKLGLWYPKDSPFDLEAYTNSDYAGASLDRKSTTGGCQFLRSRLISWDSYEKRLIHVIKIHTDHNVADLLIKAFDVKTGNSKVNAAGHYLVLLGKLSHSMRPAHIRVELRALAGVASYVGPDGGEVSQAYGVSSATGCRGWNSRDCEPMVRHLLTQRWEQAIMQGARGGGGSTGRSLLSQETLRVSRSGVRNGKLRSRRRRSMSMGEGVLVSWCVCTDTAERRCGGLGGVGGRGDGWGGRHECLLNGEALDLRVTLTDALNLI